MRAATRGAVFSCVLLGGIAIGLVPSATRAQDPPCTWRVMATPNPGDRHSLLTNIDGAANDVWAVGGFKDRGAPMKTLVLRNTSGTWSRVGSPNRDGRPSEFTDISYVGADELWAVGAARITADRIRSLVARRSDGSWTIVRVPSSGRYSDVLSSVAALPPAEVPVVPLQTAHVWAVGASYNDRGKQPRAFILHFDGTAWSSVPSPLPGVRSELTSVYAFSENDVWAVGASQEGDLHRTLALHWDGVSWATVPTPNRLDDSVLLGVGGSAPNDVWAVGFTGTGSPLVLHYNGTEWALVDDAELGPGSGFLVGIATDDLGGMWSAGFAVTATGARTLIARRTGTDWSVMDSPSPAPLNLLLGIAVPDGVIPMAVGVRSRIGGPFRTLAMSCS